MTHIWGNNLEAVFRIPFPVQDIMHIKLADADLGTAQAQRHRRAEVNIDIRL